MYSKFVNKKIKINFEKKRVKARKNGSVFLGVHERERVFFPGVLFHTFFKKLLL